MDILERLDSSQISELDADLDRLIDSLQIRPECMDDVAGILQKYNVSPDDFLGKLMLRIAGESESESESESEAEITP